MSEEEKEQLFDALTEATDVIDKNKKKENKKAVDRQYADSPEIIGCYVRDKIQGFEGVVIARTQFLTGCSRVSVAPRMTVLDRKPPDAYNFDEDQIEILDYSKLADNKRTPQQPEQQEEKRGGPPTLAAWG